VRAQPARSHVVRMPCPHYRLRSCTHAFRTRSQTSAGEWAIISLTSISAALTDRESNGAGDRILRPREPAGGFLPGCLPTLDQHRQVRTRRPGEVTIHRGKYC